MPKSGDSMKQQISHINIARDFSRFPGGRYRADGPFPGETCRKQLLVPALRSSEIVEVDLRGTLGYGSSFLEEAFGGLVREEGFQAKELRRRLRLQHDQSSVVGEIWSYIEHATVKLAANG